MLQMNRWQFQCPNNSTLSTTKRLSIRITFVGFIHVLGILVSLSSTLSLDWAWRLYSVNLYAPETYWFISSECNVFFCCVNPYALLLFCTPVREHFLKMFKKPPIQSVYVTYGGNLPKILCVTRYYEGLTWGVRTSPEKILYPPSDENTGMWYTQVHRYVI